MQKLTAMQQKIYDYIANAVRTQGYPQTSGILTTAYEAENGYVYVYFFDNYTPGKLRILADKPGQTAPVLITQETDESSGKHVTYDTPYVLFTPRCSSRPTEIRRSMPSAARSSTRTARSTSRTTQPI